MKITGIISEYDPLHAGHIYHMNAARERTGADCIVCVMDGGITQRGEFSFFDRFARVKMALAGGADAVIELPSVYACRPAEIFARGGIDLLDLIGADAVSFGCETDDLNEILACAEKLSDESPEFKQRLRDKLASGMPFPRARAEALENNGFLLSSPNFILALEYVKRIKQIGSGLEIAPVKRTQPHNSDGGLESASAVRALLKNGDPVSAAAGLRDEIRSIYLSEYEKRGFPEESRVDTLLLAGLRGGIPCTCPDDGEGLSDRVKNLAPQSASAAELAERVKCRRYTRARINRLMLCAALSLPPAPDTPPYARVLGVRKASLPLLKELKARSGGRLITDTAAIANEPVFKAECRVTDARGLVSGCPEYRRAGREFTEKFIVYE